MNIEKPQQNIYQKKEMINEIPLSWFTAVGKKGKGLSLIDFSEQFYEEFGQEVQDHINNYSHYLGNKQFKNSSDIQEENIREAVKLAEKRIHEITGVTAKNLFNKQLELYDLYGGKTQQECESFKIPISTEFF